MEELTLGELVVVTPCACHDCHNGFRWSMQVNFADRQFQRGCYVAIESLRKPFDLIRTRMADWAAQKL
eukprot:413690-Lingulodinium_polyedra.AAC.1